MTQAHEEELLDKSGELAEQKLLEMLQDPVIDEFGQKKKAYIEALLRKVEFADEHWITFKLFLVDRITVIFCKRSRALPMRQHEEHICMFTQWLSENLTNGVIPTLLNSVENAPSEILKNVSYRFATKLFESLSAYQVSLFKKYTPGEASRSSDLSLSQKQTLYYAAGYIVRKIRRSRGQNGVWRKRIKSIDERIYFNSDVECTEEFYRVKEWFDCLDRGGLVAVNENFFTCVLKIEELIPACLVTCPYGLNKSFLLSEIYKLENAVILDLWYVITQGILEEKDALAFLELFVSNYLQFSASAEAEEEGCRSRERITYSCIEN